MSGPLRPSHITYDWTMEPRTETPPRAGNSPEVDTSRRDQLEELEARVRAKQAAQPRDKTWDAVAELATVIRSTADVNLADSGNGGPSNDLAGSEPIPSPPPSCPPSIPQARKTTKQSPKVSYGSTSNTNTT